MGGVLGVSRFCCFLLFSSSSFRRPPKNNRLVAVVEGDLPVLVSLSLLLPRRNSPRHAAEEGDRRPRRSPPGSRRTSNNALLLPPPPPPPVPLPLPTPNMILIFSLLLFLFVVVGRFFCSLLPDRSSLFPCSSSSPGRPGFPIRRRRGVVWSTRRGGAKNGARRFFPRPRAGPLAGASGRARPPENDANVPSNPKSRAEPSRSPDPIK
jgi:hypothetical protein